MGKKSILQNLKYEGTNMKFKSIKVKILTITLSLLLLSLSVVIAINGIGSLSTTQATVEEILGETSKTAALAVENQLSSINNVIKEIGTIQLLSDSTSSKQEKQKILQNKAEEYDFVTLTMADKNGKLLDGQDISDYDFFKKAINGETFVNYPQITADGQRTEMLFSSPIWKNGMYGSEIVGVIFGALDGTYLSNIINEIKVGDTGSGYIINNQGTTIADANYNLVMSQENTIEMSKSDKKLVVFANLEQKAINGEACFDEVSYNGVKHFLHATPINGTDGWVLGLMVEKSEFMKNTYLAIIICIIFSLIALILSLVIMIKFSNKISKPIKDMEYAVNEISKGNFDVEVSCNTNDEIGNMSRSLEKMIETTNDIIKDTVRGLEEMSKGNFDLEPTTEYVGIYKKIEDAMVGIIVSLSNTIGSIKISADQVSSGSEQVSAGAQALSQGATEQASSIEELSATIAEISDQIKSNAENARSANKLSIETDQEVSEGNRLMQEMIVAMNEISDKSNEIGKIIKAIEDIAFQTNILALNAAVEAARAGSAGKGFAVVADEVRNLAQKSAEAVKDTTSLIEGSISAVENGKRIADETANSLTHIVEKTSIVNEKIQNITEASSIQAESVAQVTLGVEQISAVVQTNSATAEESAAASEELSSQAAVLDELVSKFKVKNI